jgi:TatD DNase family protein
MVPLDRILLETDGPFMAPEPFRGKVAHSGLIPWVGKKIAEVKGVSEEVTFRTIRENTRKMYGI